MCTDRAIQLININHSNNITWLLSISYRVQFKVLVLSCKCPIQSESRIYEALPTRLCPALKVLSGGSFPQPTIKEEFLGSKRPFSIIIPEMWSFLQREAHLAHLLCTFKMLCEGADSGSLQLTAFYLPCCFYILYLLSPVCLGSGLCNSFNDFYLLLSCVAWFLLYSFRDVLTYMNCFELLCGESLSI